MAGNKTVVLTASITNDDNSKFASFTVEYNDMPIDGVVAIEQQVVTGLLQPLVDMGKQLAAQKSAA